MKIIHLIDYFQPKIGYQETFLARHHARLGHTVSVITSDRYFPFANYDQVQKKVLGERVVGAGIQQEEGITVVRLPAVEILGSPLVHLRGLKQALQTIHPNIVFCHGVYSLTSVAVARLKQRQSFRLVYDTHAAAFNTDFSASLSRRLYHRLYQLWGMPLIKRAADALFAIGEEEQYFICSDFHIPASTVPIIRLGVETDAFVQNKKTGAAIRRQLGLSSRDVVCVHAGKLLPAKDIHVLLAAAQRVHVPQLVVLLIGAAPSGAYEAQLQRASRGVRVLRLPYVANAALPDYFSAADIAVWPGDPSITMIEALSCSLPLIVPTRRATDYLADSGAVIRFPRGDVNALSEKITHLLYNKPIRSGMAIAARTFCQKHVAWSEIARQTLSLEAGRP